MHPSRHLETAERKGREQETHAACSAKMTNAGKEAWFNDVYAALLSVLIPGTSPLQVEKRRQSDD